MMVETLRELQPEKEPWEKRRQVVLMYHAAKYYKRLMTESKTEPTDEEIGRYILVGLKLPFVMQKLETKIGKLKDKEFEREAGLTRNSENGISIEDSKRAQQAIKEKYLAINQDPAQNRAFLDSIMFPED